MKIIKIKLAEICIGTSRLVECRKQLIISVQPPIATNSGNATSKSRLSQKSKSRPSSYQFNTFQPRNAEAKHIAGIFKLKWSASQLILVSNALNQNKKWQKPLLKLNHRSRPVQPPSKYHSAMSFSVTVARNLVRISINEHGRFRS